TCLGKALHAGESDSHAGERSGAGGGGKTVDVVERDAATGKKAANRVIEDLREAARGVDRKLFQDRGAAREGEAAVLAGGIDGQNGLGHCFRSSALSSS